MNNIPAISETEFEAMMAEVMPSELDKPYIAVAASGGCDSTALVFLINRWVQKRHGKLIVLTVDHGLREEAQSEAKVFAKMLKKHDISCDILTWQHQEFPQRSIQEQARTARYHLLEARCRELGVNTLAIAHHQQDQVETFLYRLSCGSGLEGLSCMAKVSDKNHINLIRPLLGVTREKLQQTCEYFQASWIDDPSNLNEKFTRVRFRKSLEFMAEEGLTENRLAQTIAKLQQANDCITRMVERFLSEHACFYGAGFTSVDYTAWQKLDPEIQQRVLIVILKWVSGQIYPPRMERLKKLQGALLRADDFSRRTLADCEVYLQRKESKLWIYRELSAAESMKTSYDGVTFTWDNRFQVVLKGESIGVKMLGEAGLNQIKTRYDECAEKKSQLQNIPACVKYTLPVVVRGENILYVPYLNLCLDDDAQDQTLMTLEYLPSLSQKDHVIEIV